MTLPLAARSTTFWGVRRGSGTLVGGGVSERPKENASKAFVGESPPRVQIPPPPPNEVGRCPSEARVPADFVYWSRGFGRSDERAIPQRSTTAPFAATETRPRIRARPSDRSRRTAPRSSIPQPRPAPRAAGASAPVGRGAAASGRDHPTPATCTAAARRTGSRATTRQSRRGWAWEHRRSCDNGIPMVGAPTIATLRG